MGVPEPVGRHRRPSRPEPGEDLIGDDVTGSVENVLGRALERWHAPGALEAICQLPVGTLPGLVAANISLVDLYTFAPPVPVGPDASPTDRLVAFLGRRP